MFVIAPAAVGCGFTRWRPRLYVDVVVASRWRMTAADLFNISGGRRIRSSPGMAVVEKACYAVVVTSVVGGSCSMRWRLWWCDGKNGK